MVKMVWLKSRVKSKCGHRCGPKSSSAVVVAMARALKGSLSHQNKASKFWQKKRLLGVGAKRRERTRVAVAWRESQGPFQMPPGRETGLLTDGWAGLGWARLGWAGEE